MKSSWAQKGHPNISSKANNQKCNGNNLEK